MNRFIALLAASLFSIAGHAEITFPTDPTGLWAVIDVNSCGTVGKWPRPYPGPTNDTNTEGYDPGYGTDFVLVRVKGAGSRPDYDGDIDRLETPYILCGPSASVCYDTTTPHLNGTGCSETDALQEVLRIESLSVNEQKRNLANAATAAINSHWTNAAFRRDLTLLVRGLIVKSKNLSLPTSPFDFNAAFEGTAGRMSGAVDANVQRYYNLLDRINDGTIGDSEISTGWTVGNQGNGQ